MAFRHAPLGHSRDDRNPVIFFIHTMKPIFTILILHGLFSPLFAATIQNYTICSDALTRPNGTPCLITRRYQKDGTAYALVVDLQTLNVAETPLSELRDCKNMPLTHLSQTPFITALKEATATPSPLQNAGLTHLKGTNSYLTMDLCPSARPLDRPFLIWLLSSTAQRPIPIGLSITGKWLQSHESDFKWLQDQEHQGHFEITWINHSATHPYDPTQTLTKTFLRTEGIDFETEVITVEKMLLERGSVPSVFFRFPGLVSSDDLMTQLRRWSLIPIGSNAWIAKGERPKAGSIILLHANGNEPKGLQMFKRLSTPPPPARPTRSSHPPFDALRFGSQSDP